MIHTLRRFTIGSMALAVVAVAPLATATSALAAGNDPAQGTEALATLKVTSTKVEVKKDGGAKFKVAKEGGGYLYHSDHSIPTDVSFKKYQFVMECVKKYGRY